MINPQTSNTTSTQATNRDQKDLVLSETKKTERSDQKCPLEPDEIEQADEIDDMLEEVEKRDDILLESASNISYYAGSASSAQTQAQTGAASSAHLAGPGGSVPSSMFGPVQSETSVNEVDECEMTEI